MAYAANSGTRWTRERLLSAAAALALPALLGYALIIGLSVPFPRSVQDTIKLFAVEPPPPPPPPPMPEQRAAKSRTEGEASARNIRSRATEVAAPPPVVILPPTPPPVITAPKPYIAHDPTSGSAAVRGPGTGAGGFGSGFGSGGSGDGDGGGGDGDEAGPQFVRGRMSTSDLPEALFVTGFNGTVGVRYLVAVNGRVPTCQVTRSSGNAAVDDITCRLIKERFRFQPSRDGRGRPVQSWIVENHSWEVEADTQEVVETTRKRRVRLW
ncbi:energy transducer TonB [Sphingomonas mucosissima]|uniref:Gram-negative bacterial tonB protein n=1 Tax=Sphingomonas mucosissima TaxID=370959 RepID=A0A245ZQ12_9SPHN|nr:energy transducer TonB [Sphingomonas mucosissima]OWK31830.1 gram-negative bacterial tonB protein [Sphingomonas mucosissima]